MNSKKLWTLALIVSLTAGLSGTAFAGAAAGESPADPAEQVIDTAAEPGESPAGESPEGESPAGESAPGESGGMPDTSLGGNATSRPPDNSTRAIDILGSRAALDLEFNEGAYTVAGHITDAYQTEGTDRSAPAAGEHYSMQDLQILCDTIDWDEENAVGNSGLVINARTDEETTFQVGGEEDRYTAPDGKQYNSVIVMNYDENESYDESATETAAGTGIAFNGKSLLLRNAYVESNGTGRPSIHIPASTRDKNVSQMSDLICVDSTIVNHSTRAMLLMGGDVWFLNSTGITDAWGALSFDNTEATMYVVNSTAINNGNAYAIYDAAGCTAYVYGSKVISGGTGITVCRNATLTVDSLEAADETATAPYCGEADLSKPEATADGKSVIVGYAYPIKMHADMSGPDSVASAYFKDTYLSSQLEDVELSDGSEYDEGASAGGSTGSEEMNALVTEYQSGEIVEMACHNGKVVFDHCELNSRKGILVHSFFAYDAMASGIYPVDGAEYTGDEVVLKNMTAQGDILHEDYMRKMIVRLENAELTGAVTGTTLTGWNNYWKDQIEEMGGTKEDALLVIHDDTYENLWGVRMSMDKDSVWNVAGTSQLKEFAMEEGAVVQAAVGKKLTIYTDCTMDNALECYDISAGTQIDMFEPGVVYEGVVIMTEE